MNASALKVYELFKEKWGTEEASMVINYLDNSTEEKISNEIKSKVEHLATKEDISILKEDINGLRNELKEDINGLRNELKEDINGLRNELKEDIVANREEILKLETNMSKKHFDIIKWMFIFWVGAVATIISVMKFL